MNSKLDHSLDHLNDCGGCQGQTMRTPAVVNNPPALAAIAYRVGTHNTFKQSMLARLSSSQHPAIADLTTRDDDDFSVGLLDAWSTVADVLTYYQERIANESYLRTATERLSVRELARLVGYRLKPGVAASAHLAFTLDETVGAPEQTLIEAGVKVQSIPGPSEKPQLFETTQAIEARQSWNSIRPQRIQPQNLAIDEGQLVLVGTDGSTSVAQQIYLKGTDSNLKPGDLLLVVLRPNAAAPFDTLPITVQRVVVDNAANLTRVDLTGSAPSLPPPQPSDLPVATLPNEAIPFTHANIEHFILNQTWHGSDLDAFLALNGWNTTELLDFVQKRAEAEMLPDDQGPFALRQQAGFFGHNAPPQETLPSPEHTRGSDPYTRNWDGRNARTVWTDSQGVVHRGTDAFLERALSGLARRSWVLFEVMRRTLLQGRAGEDVEELQQLLVNHGIPIAVDGMFGPMTQAAVRIFQGKNLDPFNKPLAIDGIVGPLTWWRLTFPDSLLEMPRGESVFRRAYLLNRTNPVSLADYAITGKATAIDLRNRDGTSSPGKSKAFFTRQTTAHLQSERLTLAELPVVTELPRGSTELRLDSMILGLRVGQSVVLRGERADARGVAACEVLELANVVHAGGFTTLHFEQGFARSYVRDTVTINANVAPATHGETVQEVSGSGHASQTFQRFTLRQPPLTHVPAQTPSGTASTLEVRVNEVRWREVPTLLGQGPSDRVFVTQNDDDGNTTLQFGDGVIGARLPTGQENVRVKYRKGIGLDGLVKAGQLSLLLAPPLGVKEVTNPLPAVGADAPERLAEARRNAPLPLRTLNRAVSLQDYADFSRAFAGIAKALATWTWDGQQRAVFVTAAGPNAAPVPPGENPHDTLLDALRQAGDPYVQVRLDSFRDARFQIEAQVTVHPDHVPKKVLENVELALRQQFSFDARELGQPVTLSEVIAVIQAVSGVVGVDVNKLQRTEPLPDEPLVCDRIMAAVPQAGSRATPQPAELLTLGKVELTP